MALLASWGARVQPASIVVGQSLDDRDETLSSLLAAFAIGGPIAILLASLLGYALATAALRPVEAMRREAAGISFDDERAASPSPRPGRGSPAGRDAERDARAPAGVV